MPKQIFGPFNLMDEVRFKPTNDGVQQILVAMSDSGSPVVSLPPRDSEDFMQIPMWKFMTIFGPKMYPGAKVMVQENQFSIIPFTPGA